MSDFTPNGILYILKNVPLDPDYEKTLYFDDEQTQYDYFKSKRDTTLSWENRQYQKVGKGTLRVKALADKLYDCNYLMFQNRKYGNGNKWFYAFIREVRYINDDTSEIVYTLDVMQTWLFQYKDNMEECYVEREHTVSDERYEHLVPEDIGVSGGKQMVYDTQLYSPAIQPATGKSKWAIAIICTDYWKYPNTFDFVKSEPEYSGPYYIAPQDSYEDLGDIHYQACIVSEYDSIKSKFPSPPYTINSVTTPLFVYTFSNDQINADDYETFIYLDKVGIGYEDKTGKFNASLKSFLNTINKESIVTAFYYPENNGILLSDLSNPVQKEVLPPLINLQTHFPYANNERSYVAKNKKMLSYPYSYMQVVNNEGATREYQFELFSDKASPKFEAREVVLLNPEFRITPKNYACNSKEPLAISLSITQFPELAFTINAYQQYLINNGNKLGASFISDAINTGLAIAGGVTGVSRPLTSAKQAFGSISGVMDKLAMLEDKKNQASTVVGTVNTPSINFALDQIRFEFRTMRINGEMAKIIDEYFTRYGYKCMQIKKPNLKARPYFTYTKTIQCEINASIPQDDLEGIKSVFNMGTTFWYIDEPAPGAFPNDEYIGKYLTVDNQPVTTGG